MASKYTVELTSLAKEQLLTIGQYVANELRDPNAAASIIDRLETELSKLSQNPQRINIIDRQHGIHEYEIGNYRAFFIIREPEKTVRITAVVIYRIKKEGM